MLSIIMPQAFRIIIPPMTNELILLVKDSSLVYILGVAIGAIRVDQPRADRGERWYHWYQCRARRRWCWPAVRIW